MPLPCFFWWQKILIYLSSSTIRRRWVSRITHYLYQYLWIVMGNLFWDLVRKWRIPTFHLDRRRRKRIQVIEQIIVLFWKLKFKMRFWTAGNRFVFCSLSSRWNDWDEQRVSTNLTTGWLTKSWTFAWIRCERKIRPPEAFATTTTTKGQFTSGHTYVSHTVPSRWD